MLLCIYSRKYSQSYNMDKENPYDTSGRYILSFLQGW